MSQAQVALRPTTNGVAIPARNPIDIYPEWYQYLLGSYPNSQTSSIQTKAMLHQFRDREPGLMLEAVAEFVATDKRRTRDGQRVFSMPIPTELRDVLDRIQARREGEARMAEQERMLARPALRVRRDVMLQSWYAGDVDNEALLSLVREMEQAGMEHAAACLRTRLRPAPDRPDYAEFVARYARELRIQEHA